jgi:hypothetical protein
MPDLQQSLIEMDYIAAGYLTRIKAKLADLAVDVHLFEGVLSDMRQVRLEARPSVTTLVVETPVTPIRTKLAPGVIPTTIMAIFPEGECARLTLLTLTRAQLPGLLRQSFYQAMRQLQAKGLVHQCGEHMYCRVERKPHLSLLGEGR